MKNVAQALIVQIFLRKLRNHSIGEMFRLDGTSGLAAFPPAAVRYRKKNPRSEYKNPQCPPRSSGCGVSFLSVRFGEEVPLPMPWSSL